MIAILVYWAVLFFPLHIFCINILTKVNYKMLLYMYTCLPSFKRSIWLVYWVNLSRVTRHSELNCTWKSKLFFSNVTLYIQEYNHRRWKQVWWKFLIRSVNHSTAVKVLRNTYLCITNMLSSSLTIIASIKCNQSSKVVKKLLLVEKKFNNYKNTPIYKTVDMNKRCNMWKCQHN